MNKLFIKADVYNELIEKGYGKRDLSKLTRKVITDKNGHRRTVFVKNEVETTANKKPSAAYWIQDLDGNRITSEDAKKRIKNINNKLKYMDSMAEGRTKDVVFNIEVSKRRLQNYKEDLISKLNPEDRKGFGIHNEQPLDENKNTNTKNEKAEKIKQQISDSLSSIGLKNNKDYKIVSIPRKNISPSIRDIEYEVRFDNLRHVIWVNKDGYMYPSSDPDYIYRADNNSAKFAYNKIKDFKKLPQKLQQWDYEEERFEKPSNRED